MTLRTPRPCVGLAELPADVSAPVADFEIDTSDLSALARAYRGSGEPPIDEPTAVKSAQLTITRQGQRDFPDRQIFTFFDGEPWGKVRYGETVTREIAPGTHTVRVFNTMFSKTLTLEVKPGEHVRLRTGNGFPRAGWFLMVWLQATYLLVRLERDV